MKDGSPASDDPAGTDPDVSAETPGGEVEMS